MVIVWRDSTRSNEIVIELNMVKSEWKIFKTNFGYSGTKITLKVRKKYYLILIELFSLGMNPKISASNKIKDKNENLESW